ncbi:SPFH domain-containing protein [Rhodanobacter fulvus]|jgi:regulator of protease activity HflC (stomatin/prohibitin superfamily)|nr:SPFH domain-containing protein [Rhodanobacter fulvus]
MNTLISVMILGSALALLASAIKHVPAGQVYSLHRLGKPARLLQPGVHMVMPLLERVAHKINLAGQVLRLEESMADDAHDVRGTVYWQVLEPERADAVIDQVDQLIRRGAIAAMHDEPQAGEAADRRVLGTRMKLALNSALRERGMMVTRVDLDLA